MVGRVSFERGVCMAMAAGEDKDTSSRVPTGRRRCESGGEEGDDEAENERVGEFGDEDVV